jgi:hypothetical protein
MCRSHLDNRSALAIGQQVIQRKVHGLLGPDDHEALVVAPRVCAGDSYQERILDREEVREVMEEIDIARLDLCGNRDGRPAELEVLPNPKHRGDLPCALDPSQRV